MSSPAPFNSSPTFNNLLLPPCHRFPFGFFSRGGLRSGSPAVSCCPLAFSLSLSFNPYFSRRLPTVASNCAFSAAFLGSERKKFKLFTQTGHELSATTGLAQQVGQVRTIFCQLYINGDVSLVIPWPLCRGLMVEGLPTVSSLWLRFLFTWKRA